MLSLLACPPLQCENIGRELAIEVWKEFERLPPLHY